MRGWSVHLFVAALWGLVLSGYLLAGTVYGEASAVVHGQPAEVARTLMTREGLAMWLGVSEREPVEVVSESPRTMRWRSHWKDTEYEVTLAGTELRYTGRDLSDGDVLLTGALVAEPASGRTKLTLRYDSAVTFNPIKRWMYVPARADLADALKRKLEWVREYLEPIAPDIDAYY